MDTSKEYIKMCAEAAEIQEKREPENGDFCWHDNEGEEVYGCWEYPEQITNVSITKTAGKDWWRNWLWLPRQDQLQEMSNWKAYEIRFTWLGIHRMDYCKAGEYLTAGVIGKPADAPNYVTGNSMEQLWLAFVMEEKYNKTWNGEDWIIGQAEERT